MKSKYNYPIDLQPNKSYNVKVYILPPFWITFFGTPYDIVYELNVKTSSLKPNAPKLLKAYRVNSLYCKIFVKLPSNVNVSDTYEHFIPQFTVDDRIENDVLRTDSDRFKVKLQGNNKYLRLRILSVNEKYHGDFSNALTCI